MKYGIKEIKQDFKNLKDAVRFVYKSGRKEFFARIVLVGFQSILPLILLYLMKLLVDSVTGLTVKGENVSINSVFVITAVFCGVFLLIRISDTLKELNDEILSRKLSDYISNLVQEKSSELDIEYYDNPEYHDSFHRAKEEVNYRPVMVLNNITGIVSGFISLAGIIIMLAVFSESVVFIMILAGLPALFLKFANNRNIYEWRKENTPLYRKAAYFFDLLTKREFAKELRVYDLGGYLGEKYKSVRKRIVDNIRKISYKRSRLFLVSSVTETASLAGAVVILILKVASGVLTLGSFVMFFEAFRRGQGYINSVVSGISGLYENKLYLSNLFEFLSLNPGIKSPANPIPFPEKISDGIRFANVSFKYPGSEKYVIENLSFEAKPGDVFRIKGENGSGKTTVMKLLCRLYDCTKGHILIDGTDIRNFDLNELRKNIGVIFQDFSMYDFTARENIVIGRHNAEIDHDILFAASKMSRAENVINKLPAGYDTLLGKHFEHGEELSMGQWQRIALARALYADSGILILDEPTSWMDAKAEKEFYNNLEKLNKDKIIFLITHSGNSEKENKELDIVKNKNTNN